MKQIIRVLSHYQLNILAGILIGTSYIPFPPWASLFCLVPLWWQWWRADSWKQVFWGGWITQFILAIIGFHWVAYTAYEFGHLPWPIAVLTLLLFASLANLHIVIPGLLLYFLRQRLSPQIWQAALFLALTTHLLENFVPMIFPWNFGYPWYFSGLPLFQAADVIGFSGLSAITLIINAIIFWGWVQRQKKYLFLKALAGGLSLFITINIFGWWRQSQISLADSTLQVTMIQGNIGNLEKQIAEHKGRFRQEISETFFRLTRSALTKHSADLVLWPETAFPDYGDDTYRNTFMGQRLRNFIQEIKTPLLTGAYSNDYGTDKTYNALFLYDENAYLVAPPYRKTILLAFGEYLPGASYFPVLNKWIPMVSQFNRGSGPTTWTWNHLRIGLQICYEGLFAEFSRELSNQGAQIFFNVTNDSWFGTYFEPRQHLYMTLARAIEFRRPVVRTTNTGISTAALASGELLDMTKQDQEASQHLAVPFQSQTPSTFYQRWGHLEPLLVLLGVLISIPWRRRRTTNSPA